MTDAGSELYGLPLEQFTTARNELAKRLRGEGLREDAQEVAKLRKPSVAAWAVNQLARTQRRDLERLLKAGEALRGAQEDLLAGRGDPAKLRAAATGEREAAERLVERARGLLDSDGHAPAPATLEQVSQTLHAAALEEDAREQVMSGCLVRELRHVGLGALGGLGALAGPDAAAPPARSKKEKDAQRVRRLKAAEADARRRAARASKELEAAERRRDAAAERLRETEEALSVARQEAEDAVAEHRRAAKAVEDG